MDEYRIAYLEHTVKQLVEEVIELRKKVFTIENMIRQPLVYSGSEA